MTARLDRGVRRRRAAECVLFRGAVPTSGSAGGKEPVGRVPVPSIHVCCKVTLVLMRDGSLPLPLAGADGIGQSAPALWLANDEVWSWHQMRWKKGSSLTFRLGYGLFSVSALGRNDLAVYWYDE
jgi:hypothetical protein